MGFPDWMFVEGQVYWEIEVRPYRMVCLGFELVRESVNWRARPQSYPSSFCAEAMMIHCYCTCYYSCNFGLHSCLLLWVPRPASLTIDLLIGLWNLSSAVILPWTTERFRCVAGMSYPLLADVHLEAEVEYIEKIQDVHLRLQGADFAVSLLGTVETELAVGLGTSEG